MTEVNTAADVLGVPEEPRRFPMLAVLLSRAPLAVTTVVSLAVACGGWKWG